MWKIEKIRVKWLRLIVHWDFPRTVMFCSSQGMSMLVLLSGKEIWKNKLSRVGNTWVHKEFPYQNVRLLCCRYCICTKHYEIRLLQQFCRFCTDAANTSLARVPLRILDLQQCSAWRSVLGDCLLFIVWLSDSKFCICPIICQEECLKKEKTPDSLMPDTNLPSINK